MAAPTPVNPVLSPRSKWRDRIGLLLVLLGGGVLVWLAYSSLQKTEELHTKERQTGALQATLGVLNLELTRTTEAVRNAGLMLESNPQLTRAQFNRFMQKMVDNHLSVNLMEWQPIVPASQLRRFEAAAQAAGLPGYRVVQPDASGAGWAPVHGRDEYVPVRFAWPEKYRTEGLDMSFSPERMASKLQSRTVGQPVASGPFDFMKEGAVKSGTVAIAISTTVFGADQSAKGYLAAVVDLNTLFQQATRVANSAKFDVLVFASDAPDATPIFVSQRDDSDGTPGHPSLRSVMAQGPSAPLSFARQSWTLVLHPRPAFHAETQAKGSRLVLVTGMGITLLLVLIVLQRQKSRRQIAQAESIASHAGRELEMERERLQEAQRIAHVGSWQMDAAGAQVWSDEMYRILGMHPGGAAPDYAQAARLFTPERWERLNAALARTLASGEPYELELEMIKADGSHGWMLGRGEPVRDAAGAIVGARGTATDITERKRIEAKLQLAASVFSHAREGVFITDAQGIILDVNAAFTQITGYSQGDAIGQSPRLLGSSEHDPAFYDTLLHELQQHGAWSGEVWNRRKHGAVYPGLLTVSAVRDEKGVTQQYVAILSDITERKEHDRELEHIAHFDAMTNMPNRVLLADRMQQAMVQAQRSRQLVAVVYLDLDGFKAINDHHGHQTGDQVLITLSKRMRETLREGDTLARLGGDEFVAVLIALDDAAVSAPLLHRLLAAAALPVQVGDLSLQVSASLGVTFYPQTQDIDADQLLRQADQAMYQAKVAGKNRYQIFDATQDSSLRAHHESLERIRLALAHNEFVLHYQPKVNMHRGQVIGAEALIRWQHPEKGLLPPAAFLPSIEDHPLAVEVGEWVINTALAQIALWHAAGLDMPVSVNIGARQLQQANFVERLQAILARHPQVSPGKLELEVLETSALADMEQVSRVIEDCRHIGVQFALDDFGTGYSSLTYLKRLRVGLLKIDQSFVRDMLDDPDDLAILQGVIGLAAAFKREVIAEGVESVAHGTALLQLGCALAQGYGIARPMPPLDLPGWAAVWRPDAQWGAVPPAAVLTYQ